MAQNNSISLREKVNATYKTQKKLNVSDIESAVDLTALISLLALLRSWSTEQLDSIQPLSSTPRILCTTTEMTITTVSHIYHGGLLNVDLSKTRIEAFVENSDQTVSWYTQQTALIPSLQTSDRTLDIPETISFLQSLLPNGLAFAQKKQLRELMRKIAIAECVQYHINILKEYNFDEVVSDKTELTFSELLETMSVSHILPCIWSSAKSAAAFLQTPACQGRKHAYNTIHGKIRETAAKRLSGELQNKPFDRGSRCERSEISIELYGALGFDADIGFTTRLADIEIPEAWEGVSDDNEYVNMRMGKNSQLMKNCCSKRHHFMSARRFGGNVR